MSSPVTPIGPQYKDFDLKFKAHPLFGDIRPITDTNAISKSIRNIILTRPGERPFNSQFGCNIENYLFEPADAITKYQIGREIEYSITRFEKRVELEEVIIDDIPEMNTYNINIKVRMKNRTEPFDIKLTLKRLR